MYKYIAKHKCLYYLLQFTWGIILNIIGLFVFLALVCTKHKPQIFNNNIYIAIGKNWGGFSLGIFFVIDDGEWERSLYHESGHGLQNCVYGVFMILLVSIPSAIRYWYRELKYNRKGLTPSTRYEDIWFEKQATELGYKCYSNIIPTYD